MSLPREEVGQAAVALGRWMRSQSFDLRDSLLLCQAMTGYVLAQVSNNPAELRLNLTKAKNEIDQAAGRAWSEKK